MTAGARGAGAGLKRVLSSALVLLGRAAPPRGTPVLLYHSVDDSGSVISITPARFLEQMEFLHSRGYRTATLAEYVDGLGARRRSGAALRAGGSGDGRSADRTVVITFDDGFRNNYAEAFPVLRRFGFTATVFLATDYVGSVCTWERHPSIPELPMLSWSEIEEMHEHGIDFEAHTCSHPRMTRLGRDEMRRELTLARRIVERRLRKSVNYFCHPYGDTDISTQEAVRDCGYAAAFGRLDFGLRNSRENLYSLSRVGTGRFQSTADFEAGLLGTYRFYIGVRKLVSRRADPMLE